MKKRFISLVLAGLMILAVLPMLVGAAEETFTLSLSTDATVNKAAGSTVSVDVFISNVPEEGIVSATIPVFWDMSVFELVEVTNTESFIKQGWCGAEVTEEHNLDGKYYLAWNNDTWHDGSFGPVGYTGGGKLCTLKFKLLTEMTVGEKLNVEVLAPGKIDNLFNIMSWYMYDYVADDELTITDGEITVVDKVRIPGDVNNDGRVNSIDAAFILQYLADWPVTIDMSAADVTGEGRVNSVDAALILQYLADWPVTLK